jgi:outer membrane protein, heavy metal efflux system
MNVEQARRFVDAADGSASAEKVPFTFARAAELTRAHSPAIKELMAEYHTALALSKVKTPFPNPAFEAGPQIGFGPDAASKYPVQPFASIGFTIPTGSRLKRQDELNRIQAEFALISAQAGHREQYLELRKLYSRFALANQRIQARKHIVETAEKSTLLTKKLIEAGFATALDMGLIELEQARLRAELLTSEADLADVTGTLSQMTGVHSEHFEKMPEQPLPDLPETLATQSELQKTLIASHPGLARLRARYEVAERELRLEIAKQYPDFHIGPNFERETNQRKNILGLTLGIELPIFDRNQQAIATAKSRREEMRVKYEAEANRALAALDRAWRNYQFSTEKLKLLKTVVLPKAASNIELARKSLETGATDSLRFLETERAQRAILLEAIDTELSVRGAWIEIEQAIGYPLVLFPSETEQLRSTLDYSPLCPAESQTQKEE